MTGRPRPGAVQTPLTPTPPRITTHLDFQITPQPDEETCGPACLHSVYRYYNDPMSLQELTTQVRFLPRGGTLAVYLALHAMNRGYHATIYTCNLRMFDPTWFAPGAPPMRDRLLEQARVKQDPTLRLATAAYVEFLDRGGRLMMEDLTLELLAQHLQECRPIIAGLNATWLYRCMRERPSDWADDDVAGVPFGHFVVLHGVDAARRTIDVADPHLQHPYPGSRHYTAGADRVIGAILLGIVTYDAKLLILTPPNA